MNTKVCLSDTEINGSRRAVSRRTCNEEKTMFKSVKEEHLVYLRTLRDEIARRTNHDKAERLRKQREAEAMDDYQWRRYTSATTKRTGRGAR
jgi:hypothetical protein